MNQKIVILKGGYSAEREVSLVSATEIGKTLASIGYEVEILDPATFKSWEALTLQIKEIQPRIVFIGLHGGEGEDGRLQALLTLAQIPFTGTGYIASAIAMDKFLSKLIAKELNVPIPAYRLIYHQDVLHLDDIVNDLGLPLVVKPNDSGSSVGVSIVKTKEDLLDAINQAFQYGTRVLVEEFIEGRELTVTILDGKPLPVVEIRPKAGWYDYVNKYTKGQTEYLVPAPLTNAEAKRVQQYALSIYQLMNCQSYSRIDFRFTGKEFYFLEVNTLPGMTSLSLTPMAAKASGVDFGSLLETIIRTSEKIVR